MLSQSVGYAITALGHLGRSDDPRFVRDLASETGIPAPYLAKIVHQLARRGFLLTQRGTRGGVLLARKASQITLFELCVALDDPLVQRQCMLGNAACSDERSCPLHVFWKAQREHIAAFLQQTTVQDIARFSRPAHASPFVPSSRLLAAQRQKRATMTKSPG